jgi:hypothetical protein
MAQSFTPYQTSNQYPAGDAPFRIAETFGAAPRGRDYLDNLRMYWRRTPEAEYPDGYLGTINTRRGDRLLDSLKQRAQNRPYTRGIHKGTRIDASDYFWPPEFNQWTALQMEAEGLKFFPPGIAEYLPDERYPTDGRVGPRGVPVGSRQALTGAPRGFQDPDRIPVLRGQAPPWASGARGNPGMTTPYPGR